MLTIRRQDACTLMLLLAAGALTLTLDLRILGFVVVVAGFGLAGYGLSKMIVPARTRLDRVLAAVPFAFASPSRLLPQTFRGTTLSSRDFDGLTLNTGYIDRIDKRNSTNYEAMTIASPNRRFNATATTSHMAYLGGDYQVSKTLSLHAYHVEVTDLYQQDTFALLHELRPGLPVIYVQGGPNGVAVTTGGIFG